jgi:hypothetical protein
MNSRTRFILINILGGITYLLLPILSSPDFNTGQDLWTIPPFLKSFTTCIILLAFFYLNYYILLPRLYFSEQKKLYGLAILFCFAAIITIPSSLFPDHFMPNHLHGFENTPMRKPNGISFQFVEGGVFQFLFVLFLCFLLKINTRFDQMKNEKQTAEISYLKAQINPHFLFNTLNSLYALTIMKSDQAPNAVLKLSNMMRYVVTESAKDFVSLDKEIAYIKDYIELQKLRIDKNAALTFSIEGITTGHEIAPLILIPFIENAFKYGINPDKNSFISILISIQKQKLLLTVENSIVASEIDEELKTEEGLNNTQKRLNLIYNGHYELNYKEENKTYRVSLTIDLS